MSKSQFNTQQLGNTQLRFRTSKYQFYTFLLFNFFSLFILLTFINQPLGILRFFLASFENSVKKV
jgi:hypothetical protein